MEQPQNRSSASPQWPKDIKFRRVCEPDMDRMVKALRIVLESGGR